MLISHPIATAWIQAEALGPGCNSPAELELELVRSDVPAIDARAVASAFFIPDLAESIRAKVTAGEFMPPRSKRRR